MMHCTPHTSQSRRHCRLLWHEPELPDTPPISHGQAPGAFSLRSTAHYKCRFLPSAAIITTGNRLKPCRTRKPHATSDEADPSAHNCCRMFAQPFGAMRFASVALRPCSSGAAGRRSAQLFAPEKALQCPPGMCRRLPARGR